MPLATQQKAKQLSQQWWNSQASKIPQGKPSSDSMQNFVDTRSNNTYQQAKADYNQQYQTQLYDNNQAYQTAWRNKRNAQIEDMNQQQSFQREMSSNQHRENLEMARFNRYGNANAVGSTTSSVTTFNPEYGIAAQRKYQSAEADKDRAANMLNSMISSNQYNYRYW